MSSTDIPKQGVDEEMAQAEQLSKQRIELTTKLTEALDLPESTAEEYEQKELTLKELIAEGRSVKANLEIGSPEHQELVTALFAAEREMEILMTHEQLVQAAREIPDVDPGLVPTSLV